MGISSDSYWNEEDDREIICPYCREKYTPTYEETIIGDKCVDCYEEGEVQTVTCDSCGKKSCLPNRHSKARRLEEELQDRLFPCRLG